MRALVTIAVVVGLASAGSQVPDLPPQTPLPVPKPFTGTVTWLADGDTMEVRAAGGPGWRVRLYGVDCPESAQPFGPEAAAFARALVYRKPVTVVPHAVDDYGRTVGVVVMLDGRELDRELVRAGLAWWYRHFAPEEAGDYGVLEKEARRARRGLWRQTRPEAPWSWRRRHQSDHGAHVGSGQ